jgi:AcrR family transcriptional regulator
MFSSFNIADSWDFVNTTCSMTNREEKQSAQIEHGPNKWLDAAIETLIAEGMDAVRIERLATKLHITRGSFYHHYKDRDDLLRAVLEHYVQINHQNLVAMLPALKGTPKDKLWTLWTATASQEFRDYDWAIRMWGMHDPHVAGVLNKIDVKRMDVMMDLFREMGFNEDESWIRAALAYHGSLGDRAFFGPFPPMAKRLEWRKIALNILCRAE